MGVTDTPLRAAVRALLPGGAFLRIDREEALFVTDAPRRGAGPDLVEALEKAGFSACTRGGLLAMVPKDEWMPRLTEALGAPEDEQSALLKRLLKRSVSAQDRAAWICAVKCMECGCASAAAQRRIRACAAVALRTGRGGGALYHAYMVLGSAKEKGEEK